MRIGEAAEHLVHRTDGIFQVPLRPLLNVLIERTALDKLHCDVSTGRILVVEVEDGDDRRVIEACYRACFVTETRAELLRRNVLLQVEMHDLDSYLPLEHRIPRAIHGPHAARGDGIHNLVPANFLRDYHKEPESKCLTTEHVYRFGQAAPHSVERRPEQGDLIVALGGEVRRVLDSRSAAADLIGDCSEFADRPQDEQRENDIDHQEQKQKQAHQENYEVPERLLCTLQRQVVGHADDLRTNGFVQLPAEAVVTAVFLYHGRRRGPGGTMALEAVRIENSQRTREIECLAGRGVALTDQLLGLGVRAEVVDDIHLPIDGAIAQVTRIERGFFVRIVGKAFAEIVEILHCRVGGD